MMQSSVKGLPGPVARPEYTAWYLVSLVAIVLLVVIAVLGLTIIRPNADNTQLISTVVGIALLAIPALLGYIKGAENGAAIRVYHESVNGNMEKWIAAAEELARLQGAESGRLQQAQVADKSASDALALAAVVGVRTASAVTGAGHEAPSLLAQKMLDHSEQWARIFH